MKDIKLKEEMVSYPLNGSTMNNFVVYDENTSGKRPVVLVIHEWWGLNDYIKMRARELAKLGYFAMAVDMYGDGRIAGNPTDAQNYSAPFYEKPEMAKTILDAALVKLASYPQADTGEMAAIGYCFGGTQVLNLALMGENLKGVVSFHGVLSVTTPEKDRLKARMLVCHGNDDKFVSPADVEKFKHQMDSIGANYTFIGYSGATHAFTNPNATALGEKFKIPIAYNAAADTASWNEMKDFFGKIFR